MKAAAFWLLVAVLGLLAVLVTGEILLRATGFERRDGSQRDLHELRLDRPWLFGLRPGARITLPITGDVIYEINADGFRGPRRPQEVPRDHLRVLALGASVTFGFGVDYEDTFAFRLEELLTKRRRQEVDVLDFGVNGYNPYNQEALLADVGLSYRPDLVLVEFGATSIQDPAIQFDAQTRVRLAVVPDEAFPSPESRHESSGAAFLLRLCAKLRTCSLVDAELLARQRESMNFIKDLVPRDLSPGSVERRWLRDRYRGMAALAESTGAKFAIVAFPYALQVYKGAPTLVQEQLLDLCREEGWPVLDLVPVFRRAAQAGAPRLLLDPWHPTPEGHALAAAAIADWLEEEGLLPAPPTRSISEAGTRRVRTAASQ